MFNITISAKGMSVFAFSFPRGDSVHAPPSVTLLPLIHQGCTSWPLQEVRAPFSGQRHVAHLLPTSWVTSTFLKKTFAFSGWGSGTTTLRTATLALVHSTAKYCVPVWCCSAHSRLFDPATNDTVRVVTECLRPTPADNLPILAGIQHAELHRKGDTFSLGRCAMEPGHLLHSALTFQPGANARRLKSGHLFLPTAQQLIISSENNNIPCGAVSGSPMEYEMVGQTYKTPHFILDTGIHPSGMTFRRTAWIHLNRLRTGVGCFRPT